MNIPQPSNDRIVLTSDLDKPYCTYYLLHHLLVLPQAFADAELIKKKNRFLKFETL